MTMATEKSTPAGAGTADKMGSRFVEAGLLTQDQVARVVELQNSANIRFGEAAVRLGLLTEQNVQTVLSEQFNYATALMPTDSLDDSLDIALAPFGLEAFHKCCRLEGIIPALESAHALAEVFKRAPNLPKDHLMVVNLSV